MIVMVATVRVREGKNAEFEAGVKALAEKVRANEPGTLVYQLAKSRTEPDAYKMIEIYADADARAKHGQSDYLTAARPMFAQLTMGPPDMEQLDGV